MRVVTLVVSALFALCLIGCGKDDPAKPPSGGNGTKPPDNPGNPVVNPGGQQPPVAVPRKGWTGAKFKPRANNELPLVITEVSPDSPALRAGIHVGDLVLKKNGEPVTDMDAFKVWITSLTPDMRYTLTLQREGKEIEVTVTVGVRAEAIEGGGRLAPPAALEAGMKWLASQQLENGAWPHAHETIILQRGNPNPAVTGLALSALSSTQEGRAKYAAQIAKGIAYMLSRETPTGYLAEESDAMRYGNFATAYALIVMCRVDKAKYKDDIKKLVSYFEKMQINEAHGFEPYDWPYGAWDYYDDIRQRPMRADIVLASLVIDALHAADVPGSAPVMKNALKYVKMCQNWKDDPNQLTEYDDGGFVFTPREGKAGEKEVGGGGNLKFVSYGSVTLDGIRSLIQLGEPKDSSRVKAARDWIANNYNLEMVPGFPPRAIVDFSHGLRYYYYMSMAKTMQVVGDPVIRTPQGSEIKWSEGLASYVAGLQRPDGTWANGVSVMNEDDPLFATGMAVHALAIALGHAQ